MTSADALKEMSDTVVELRRILGDLKKEHNEAKEALRFYANPKNYGLQRGFESASVQFQNVLVADNSEADNNAKTKIAGARARLFFQTYGE